MLLREFESLAAVAKNSLRIEPRHYDRNLDRAQAAELFRDHVELVEFETTSYCNRTCSFCPNSQIDRRSEKTSMPEATWRRIVDDLRELDYSGTIVWSRYSEPTSEKRIVERIAEVRQAAPRARIAINSNGDYLTPAYLDRLIAAGLDRMWVDLYIGDDEDYDQVAKTAHDRFLARIGKTATVVSTTPEYFSRVHVPGFEMTAVVRNSASMLKQDLSDRGGLVQIARKTRRVAPCFAPFKHLVIDWDGSVVVCCQLRSDANPHKSAVVSRIGEEAGLVEAYVALADWRKSLRGFGPKAPPCDTCNVYEYHARRPAVMVSRIFGEEQLPGVRLLKRPLSRIIGKSRRP